MMARVHCCDVSEGGLTGSNDGGVNLRIDMVDDEIVANRLDVSMFRTFVPTEVHFASGPWAAMPAPRHRRHFVRVRGRDMKPCILSRLG